jgi:hypothetical protein
MADYFMQLKQFDKAVDLLAAIDRVCFHSNHFLLLIYINRLMKQQI